MGDFSFHTSLLRSTEMNYLNKPLSRFKKANECERPLEPLSTGISMVIFPKILSP